VGTTRRALPRYGERPTVEGFSRERECVDQIKVREQNIQTALGKKYGRYRRGPTFMTAEKNTRSPEKAALHRGKSNLVDAIAILSIPL